MAAIETLRRHPFVEQNQLIIAVELVKYLKRHITTASREERVLGSNWFKASIAHFRNGAQSE
jgi:hypothetical protein